MADAADHLALVGFHHRGGIALERVTERIVGRDEEPEIAAVVAIAFPVPFASAQVS